MNKRKTRTAANKTYIFEGVYGISLKKSNDSIAYFYGWEFLKRPYINKIWKMQNNTYFSLVAFSGNPPTGQALLCLLDPEIAVSKYQEQQKEEERLIKNGIPHPLIIL